MKYKCNICQSILNFLLKKDNFDLYKCPNCELISVCPTPSLKILEKVYSFNSGYQSTKPTDLSKVEPRKSSLKIIDVLKKSKPKGRLLDVGCSNGEFLYLAQKKGYDCFGVEVNKGTAKIAQENGLKVFNGFLEDAKFKKEYFDIIYLGDIIEHVQNPKLFIDTCLSYLKRNGLLVISTPNTDCFWSKSTFLVYKLFKVPWSMATPPSHLSYFNFRNLNLMLIGLKTKLKEHWYNPPPKLFHELYQTQLAQKYYENKSYQNRIFQFFGFGVYSGLYLVNKIFKFLLSKDFSMLVIYQKK